MLVFIGDRGLCPICGEEVEITGYTTDGRLVGSCGDAFALATWTAPDDDPEEEET